MKRRAVVTTLAAVAVLAVGTAVIAATTSSPTAAPPHECLSVSPGSIVVDDAIVHLSCEGTTSTDEATSTSTETTVPETSTTAPSATTLAPTTTTTLSETTTTAQATTTTQSNVSECGLSNAAFCETFDAPAANAAGKTGDLDSVLWGVSRVGDENPGQKLNDMAFIRMDGPCGDSAFHAVATSPTAKSTDIKICDGRMYETVNDGGTVAHLNTYPKQPFDFTGRTGKVVFDVSSDSQGSHGAWPEFVITDKPVPGMRTDVSGAPPPTARHEVGFALSGSCDGQAGITTTVGQIFVTSSYVYQNVPMTVDGCVRRGTLTSLNHVEVRVSTSSIEIWMTDPGSTALIKVAHADNLNLSFSKGLVWMNDVHYNARKALEPCECGTQWNHTFAWDNLGFDGPKTYRDLGYNVPDQNTPGAASTHGAANDSTGAHDPGTMTHTGWQLNPSQTFSLNIPTPPQTPTSALMVFNWWSQGNEVPSFSVNGNPPITTAPPPGYTPFFKATIDVPIPLDQLHLGAANSIKFSATNGATTLSNVSIILVAGAPVP